MASREQLRAVAQNCSAFTEKGIYEIRDCIGSNEISCEYCVHYTSQHQCDIDLIDEILIRITDDV